MSGQPFVILTVAILAMVLLGFLALRRGRAAGASATPGSSTTDSGMSNLPVGEQDLVLVPLPNDRNEALVLGTEQELEAFERSGLTERSGTGSRGLLPQVVRQVMGVGGQVANKRANDQIDAGRIVALSKETMEQLKKNPAARDKAGNMLGLVRGDRGRYRHVMRLDKAGAKAVTASNAMTLALTAAVSLQLEHIEQQLTAIQDTLKELVADKDRERLTKIIAANDRLRAIADTIRLRGKMTDADRTDLSALGLPVTESSIETEFKFEELLLRLDPDMHRGERLEELERLRGDERLEYWVAVRVEAELARTRFDVLNLYWEQSRHPETAGELADRVRHAITARRTRLEQIGKLLEELADPEARTRLDPLRQISRHRLKRQEELVDKMLSKHGQAFSGPANDPFAIASTPGQQEVLLLRLGTPEPGTRST